GDEPGDGGRSRRAYHVGGGGGGSRRSGPASQRGGAARGHHRQGLSQPGGGERSRRMGRTHILCRAESRTAAVAGSAERTTGGLCEAAAHSGRSGPWIAAAAR